MKVDLVVNPIAGNRAYKYINRIQHELSEKKVDLTTCITRKKGDACEYARNITGSDRIIVASGDGTLNEVVNGIRTASNPGTHEIPIALIPLGITNVLAKELRVPDNVEQAIDLAINGKIQKCSLGRINGKYFILMAGVGIDGETVLGLKNNFIKKISGKAAHIVSGFKVLIRYKPHSIKVKTRDQDISGYNVIISNIKCYGGNFHVTPLASITEPVLDVCVFRGKKRRDILRYVTGVIFNKHLTYHDIAYFKANEIEVTSEETVHIQIDGDYFGNLPAKIDVLENAVSFVH